MAMSKGVSIGSIVTGFLLLLLTLISVNLGWVVMINLTEPDAGVSIGLWGFYVSTLNFTNNNNFVLCLRKQPNSLYRRP